MHPFVRAFPLLLALAAQACGSDDGGGDLGAPCNVDEDCSDGLACDVHDGRGSCQNPHDH